MNRAYPTAILVQANRGAKTEPLLPRRIINHVTALNRALSGALTEPTEFSCWQTGGHWQCLRNAGIHIGWGRIYKTFAGVFQLMGEKFMTSDLDIQQQEDDFREDQAKRMAYDAAVMVAAGDTRAAAVQAVKDQQLELDDASENELIRDDDGSVYHIDDTSDRKEPERSPKAEAQIRAIQHELLPDFQ